MATSDINCTIKALSNTILFMYFYSPRNVSLCHFNLHQPAIPSYHFSTPYFPWKTHPRFFMSSGEDNVRVIVRCRPFNQRELQNNEENIIDIDENLNQVTIRPPGMNSQVGRQQIGHKVPRSFTYDAVYGESSRNIQIFNECFAPLMGALFEGFNCTIFCYGVTGSGKTYTMSCSEIGNEGCVPNAFGFLFRQISSRPDVEFLLKAAFYELYNEELRDLVTGESKLQIKESKAKGTFIKDLSEYVCSTEADLKKVFTSGQKNRSVAATNMNDVSSRSHNVFRVILEQAAQIGTREVIKRAELNLVDLAGSERQGKAQTSGQRLKEAVAINLSLTALGVVIQKLVDGAGHIPYRDSILTRLLKDSLGGNAKTLMVANIGPAGSNYDETFSSLRYANQAKRIKNKPKVNEDPKDAQIRLMRDRIKFLEAQLQQAMAGGMIQDIQGILGSSGSIQSNNQLNTLMMHQDYMGNQNGEYQEELEEVWEPEEAERLRMLNQQNVILSEKLQREEESTAACRLAIEEMRLQLQALKNAVVTGTELMQSNQQRQAVIEATKAKLLERQARETALQNELQRRKTLKSQQGEFYGSEAAEIATLKQKVTEIKQRIIAVTQDIQMVKREHQSKVDDISEATQLANKKLMLLEFIEQNFIPVGELEKASQWMQLDDDSGQLTTFPTHLGKQFLAQARLFGIDEYPRGNRIPVPVGGEQSREFVPLNAAETLKQEKPEIYTESLNQ